MSRKKGLEHPFPGFHLFQRFSISIGIICRYAPIRSCSYVMMQRNRKSVRQLLAGEETCSSVKSTRKGQVPANRVTGPVAAS
ncbi:MAG: hypothetical protein DWI02_11760 [Planctomycetota bacterium]|nr:MAG: hypothetical protein DWI02_11760 [Planctomycetota bacterium]